MTITLDFYILSGNVSYWFFDLPKSLVSCSTDLKIKFIKKYMDERQLRKDVAFLDDVRQGKIE